MHSMDKKVSHWLPFIAYLGFIYFLSTRPKPIPLDIPNIPMDFSFLHIIEFFILAFLLLRIFYAHKIKYEFILTILLITLLGIIDEVIQGYISGRTSSLIDAGLDFIGASLVLIFKNKKLSNILSHKNK